MRGYPKYLWQVISEPGEGMYRLGQDKPVGLAVATCVLPSIVLGALALSMAREPGAVKFVTCRAAVNVTTALIFMVAASGLCHLLARFVAGGEGLWVQMLVVCGFSFAVRLLDALGAAVPQSAQSLLLVVRIWQGAIIVIGIKEVYGLSWGRGIACALPGLVVAASVTSVVPRYIEPYYQKPPIEAHGDPVTVHLTTPNLLDNPGFEDAELGTMVRPEPPNKPSPDAATTTAQPSGPASGPAQRPRPIYKGWHSPPGLFIQLPGVKLGRDMAVARTGKSCAFVSKTGLAVAQPHILAQTVDRLPGKGNLQASAWFKTEDVSRALFLLTIRNRDGKNGDPIEQYNAEMLTGTNDWKQVSVQVELKEQADGALVAFGMWGKGTVWVDDVALRTEFPPPAKPAATVTAGPAATTTAAPTATKTATPTQQP